MITFVRVQITPSVIFYANSVVARAPLHCRETGSYASGPHDGHMLRHGNELRKKRASPTNQRVLSNHRLQFVPITVDDVTTSSIDTTAAVPNIHRGALAIGIYKPRKSTESHVKPNQYAHQRRLTNKCGRFWSLSIIKAHEDKKQVPTLNKSTESHVKPNR